MNPIKIPFYEHRQILDKSLSKLFNIVVNYYGLNSPDKVGMCTQIYAKYFKNNSIYNYEDAKKYYFNSKNNLKSIISNYQKKAAIESLNLLSIIDKYLDKNSKEYNDVDILLKNNSYVDRNFQYKNILFKTISIFHNKNESHLIIYNKILNWRNELKSFNNIYIRLEAQKYLENLLTIESMIGTIIEYNILNFLKTNYNFEIFKSDVDSDKNEIDAFINGHRASIKSIKYKNSGYAKVASINIKAILKGAPIIEYKIIEDSYIINNLKEVIEFYSTHKKNLDLKIFEKVKSFKI